MVWDSESLLEIALCGIAQLRFQGLWKDIKWFFERYEKPGTLKWLSIILFKFKFKFKLGKEDLHGGLCLIVKLSLKDWKKALIKIKKLFRLFLGMIQFPP